MLKKNLREKYLEKRKTLSIDEVNFLSDKIFEKFILQFNLEYVKTFTLREYTIAPEHNTLFSYKR